MARAGHVAPGPPSRGEVAITDEEWESMPQRPDLIITRAGSVMRWTALLRGPGPGDQERGDEDYGLLPFPEAT